MPSPVRPLLAALALLATHVCGQDPVSSVLRSDQTATFGFLVLNSEATAREFLISADESPEPGWVVVYLQAGNNNISNEVLSPAGIILSVPPGPDGLAIQAVFLPAGAQEGQSWTSTISATPVDGNTPLQSRSFLVRMLSKIVVNDERDLSESDLTDEFLDADPNLPGEQITLRAALEFSNRRGGMDCIAFDLPGAGVPRILPQTPYPEITSSIEIDGTTQPNIAGTVGVEISGEALPEGNSSNGLTISAGGSTLRGLAFTRFRSVEFGAIPPPIAPNPNGLLLKGTGGNTIVDCFLGATPSGQEGSGNEGYGIRIECADNTVEGCLISGNWVGGIGIFGPEATGNIVTSQVGGSLDGTRSSNFLAPALTFESVELSPLQAFPIFDPLDRNLANSSIHFTTFNEAFRWESTAAGYLGGIVVHDAPENTITECAIRGNGADGIRVLGDATGTTLGSNLIGQPLGGSLSLRNAGHGIALECDNCTLELNETHGNSRSGVLVRGVDNVIAGLRSSRNGECGVRCEGRGTLIGGTVFSAKGQFFSNPIGILLTSPNEAVNYTPGFNQIRGNLIGAESSFGGGQTSPRPNSIGIHIDGSSQNIIGGAPRTGNDNTIVYNQREGILVSRGEQNQLFGNVIASNGRLDVDLSDGPVGDGRDPNDLDTGGNRKTNAPALLSAAQGPDSIEIRGQLLSEASGVHTIELVFSVPDVVVIASQFAEVQSLNVPGLSAALTYSLGSLTDLRGSYLRAAATDPSFNSSEYSEWIRIEGIVHTDGDGVSDAIEDKVVSRILDGNGDGNGDGFLDSAQAHVASLPVLSEGFLTVVAPPGVPIENIAVNSLASQHPLTSMQFPHGTWRFDLGTLAVGQGTTLTIHPPRDQAGQGYYNFGPTPDNPTPHWYDFSFDGSTGAQVFPDRVLLHFVDGQRGDHDLTLNGNLNTQGGMTTPLPALPDPSFTSLRDGTIVISWPRDLSDLFLQENSMPASSPWEFTNEPSFATDSSQAIRIFPNRNTQLFRLVRP